MIEPQSTGVDAFELSKTAKIPGALRVLADRLAFRECQCGSKVRVRYRPAYTICREQTFAAAALTISSPDLLRQERNRDRRYPCHHPWCVLGESP
jgi:hypothetical protein